MGMGGGMASPGSPGGGAVGSGRLPFMQYADELRKRETQARERKHALHDASAREHELTNAFVGVQQQVEAQRMATRRAEDLTAKERRRADEATLKANDWRRHLKRAQAEVRRSEELLAQSEKERLELRSKYVEQSLYY